MMPSGMRGVVPVMLLGAVCAACSGPKEIRYDRPQSISFPDANQTRADESIRAAAERLRSDSGILAVGKIFDWFKHNTVKGGRRFFLERDAALLYQDRNMSGCIDVATLFAAFARAMDIPTVFVHAADSRWAEVAAETGTALEPAPDLLSATGLFTEPDFEFFKADDGFKVKAHTFLELYLDGAWRLLDPTLGKLFVEYDPGNPQLPDGYVVQARGGDMWAMGFDDLDSLKLAMKEFVRNRQNDDSKDEPAYPMVALGGHRTMECYEALFKHVNKGSGGSFDLPDHCSHVGLHLEGIGLLPVGPGGYELVAVYDSGDEEVLGSFNIRDGRSVGKDGKRIEAFPLPRSPRTVRWLEVRYESGESESRRNHGPVVLAGRSNSLGASPLRFVGKGRIGATVRAPGSFFLREQTTGGGKEVALWFEKPGKQPCGLSSLPEEWRYELWLMGDVDGLPVQKSLGRLVGTEPGDAAVATAGPAECFGTWLTGGAGALQLSQKASSEPVSLVVTIEPEPDPVPESPFYLRILEAEVPAGTGLETSVPLDDLTSTLPSGKATLVW